MATEYFNDAWRIPNNKNQSLVSNYSMEFNGISDKIGFGDVNGFDITDKFSGSCWIYSTAAGSDYILGKEQSTAPFTGYMLYIDPNRKLRFIMAVGFGAGNYFGVLANSSAIPYNTWTHLAFTYDGSTNRTGLKLYINSVLQAVSYTGNSTISGSMLNSNVPFQISGRGGSAANGINGKIDQTCMFDYALPATGTNSVATLYGGGTAVTNPMVLNPKPISYYQLGDQSVDNGANYLVPNNSLQDYVFNFDGTDDYIDCGNDSSLQFASSFSISAWVKINDTSNNAIISKDSSGATGNGYHIDFRSGNQVHAWAYNASNKVIKTGLSIDTWYHIVFVFENTGGSNGTQSLYINGGTAVTSSITNFASSTINNLRIGNSEEIAGFQTNGLISNVALFNTNLTSTQVQTLYNNGSPAADISSLSPISWWKLNAQDTFDGTNWTINDYAGSNDGTSSGMTSANLVQSNLQHTSGYSPYALDFSGITAHLKTYTIPAQTNTVTLSAWVKRTGATGNSAGIFGVRNSGGGATFGVCWDLAFLTTTNKIEFRIADTTYRTVTQNDVMPDNTWTHVAGVADGNNIKLYINGVLQTDIDTYSSNLLTPTSNIFFAAQGPAGSNTFNGQLSNCARWNIGLTQAEVTEIYNQGVPSNLNTFSGTTPIGWWQLGSNSSFEGNDWTCLDEIGTDYADSGTTAMTEDDIVNGVGYSANGLGTSSIEIIGDAPYSTANGISNSMDVLDRTTDVPT